MTHGILSNAPLLANEDPKAYRKLMRDHLNQFHPVGPCRKRDRPGNGAGQVASAPRLGSETASIDMQMHEEQDETKAKFTLFDEPSRTAHALKSLSNHWQ